MSNVNGYGSFILFLVELFDAQVTTPAPFWRLRERRIQTVHVISPVAVIAKQKLIIVVWRAANRAALALDALPTVLLHRDHHVWSELQTRWVAWSAAVRAWHQLLGLLGLFVFGGISETEVAVGAWGSSWSLTVAAVGIWWLLSLKRLRAKTCSSWSNKSTNAVKDAKKTKVLRPLTELQFLKKSDVALCTAHCVQVTTLHNLEEEISMLPVAIVCTHAETVHLPQN